MPEPPGRTAYLCGVLGGIIMFIKASSGYFDCYNFVPEEERVLIVGKINNDTPLHYWLTKSRMNEYEIEITAKDTINMWIPNEHIEQIKY